MDKIKILSVFGTRPEATKMVPLIKLLAACPEIESKVCVTAQHRQMLDQVLGRFPDIKPDFDLDIMSHRQTLNDVASRVLTGMAGVFAEYRPDCVLVHGDTTTTLASALAAFNEKIPVGHVEAGLRTFDKYSPYPEEMNRLLTTRIADLHFCPTEANRQNLLNEGITENVLVTGNTAVDWVKLAASPDYVFVAPVLRDLDFEKHKVVMMTAHRRENYDFFDDMFSAVRDFVQQNEDVLLVYPVHMSPTVREYAHRILGDTERVMLIEPTDVMDNINLMARSYFIITDSGGLQEEGPALGKPVVVMRRDTERPEAVEAGTCILAGVTYDGVLNSANAVLRDKKLYDKMSAAKNPYGDGRASERIVGALIEWFKEGKHGRF